MIKRSELLLAFSYLIDLLNPLLSGHHLKTAYIANELSAALKLWPDRQMSVTLAALVHDLGLIACEEETAKLVHRDSDFYHSGLTADLLNCCEGLRGLAKIVRFHHSPFMMQDDPSFQEIYILYFADQIAVSLQNNMDKRNLSLWLLAEDEKAFFRPYVAAFLDLLDREEFWHDLNSVFLKEIIARRVSEDECFLTLPDFLSWAKRVAALVDHRSGSNSLYHSKSVARVSEMLAHLSHFPLEDYIFLNCAGYLHDIGKVVIPQSVLQQTEPLTKEEVSLFKTHPLHAKHILDKIKGLSKVSLWVAYHHERMNEFGYPFQVKPSKLDLGSRIMGAANFFVTLLERKPYRDVLEKDVVINILEEVGSRLVFDPDLLKILARGYDFFNFVVGEIQNN